MTTTADVIIAGAGHNSLITAAYLAKAGYECLILEAREIPGGGSTTEELLGPRSLVDTCSTGHTLILVNPLIKDDELGLVRDYGLSMCSPTRLLRWRCPMARRSRCGSISIELMPRSLGFRSATPTRTCA